MLWTERRQYLTLTKKEMNMAFSEGRKRYHDFSLVSGRTDLKMRADDDGVFLDQLGAAAEIAVARFLGRKWTGKGVMYDQLVRARKNGKDLGDVDNIEVRITRHRRNMVIRPRDPDHKPFVGCMTSGLPEIVILGWCYGFEGKLPHYYYDHPTRPCWFVPESGLHRIATLKEKLL